jgi:hypothetical protein
MQKKQSIGISPAERTMVSFLPINGGFDPRLLADHVQEYACPSGDFKRAFWKQLIGDTPTWSLHKSK